MNNILSVSSGSYQLVHIWREREYVWLSHWSNRSPHIYLDWNPQQLDKVQGLHPPVVICRLIDVQVNCGQWGAYQKQMTRIMRTDTLTRWENHDLYLHFWSKWYQCTSISDTWLHYHKKLVFYILRWSLLISTCQPWEKFVLTATTYEL